MGGVNDRRGGLQVVPRGAALHGEEHELVRGGGREEGGRVGEEGAELGEVA